MIITFKERKELFKSECKVINLEFEYESCVYEAERCLGDIKWAIITDLSEEELEDKYSDIIVSFTSYVVLTLEQGEIIKEFVRNEDKFRKRQLNNEDAFGYEDGLLEVFHNEIASPDYWQEKDKLKARIQYEDLLDFFEKALDELTSIQRERLYAHLVDGKSSRVIAKEEGVNYSNVDKSIILGRKKLLKILKKGGAFRGGNSK